MCVAAQEARFDRHFVRDLTWSRHQLEELAERRFVAAQRQAAHRAAPGGPGGGGADGWGDAPGDPAAATSFIDLFKKARPSCWGWGDHALLGSSAAATPSIDLFKEARPRVLVMGVQVI